MIEITSMQIEDSTLDNECVSNRVLFRMDFASAGSSIFHPLGNRFTI